MTVALTDVSEEARLTVLLIDDLITQLGGDSLIDDLCATDGYYHPAPLLSTRVTASHAGQKLMRTLLSQVVELMGKLGVKGRVVSLDTLKGKLKTGSFGGMSETVRSAVAHREGTSVQISKLRKLRDEEAAALAEHARLQAEVRRLQEADIDAERIRADAKRLVVEATEAAA